LLKLGVRNGDQFATVELVVAPDTVRQFAELPTVIPRV
jgi:hypothetical protein